MQEPFDKANQILAAIQAASPATPDEIEQFRIKYLGSKNELKELFGLMAQIPAERKKEYGQLMNTLKAAAEEKLEQLKAAADTKPTAAQLIYLTLRLLPTPFR
jgi:phenylalanyl-tRNA synthetase alpha chain